MSDNNIDKLDDSFASAYQVLERKKSNLAFAFFCLDKSRARDMDILYTYCRILDDISDDEKASNDSKKIALNKWSQELDKIYNNQECSPFGKELKAMIERRKIPQQYMQDVIDGVYTDTLLEPFKTSEQLKKYCYGVASAVGLCSIYVFGFSQEITKEFAKALGYALQYTNILRDIVDDFHRQNRVYIPQEELDFFGLSHQDLAEPNEKTKKLFKFLHFRAKHYFNMSRRLLCQEDKKSMMPALIMSEIYEAILDKIEASDFNIQKDIIKLSKPQKIFYALRAIKKAKQKTPNRKNGKVAIFGAGLSGCISAFNLCKDGFDVDLYEARNYPMGRACLFNWKAIDSEIDNSNHAIMKCYNSFIKSLKDFDSLDVLQESESKIEFVSPDKTRIDFDISMMSKSPLKFLRTFGGLSQIKGFQTWQNTILLLKIKFGLACLSKYKTAEEFLNANKINQVSKDVFWTQFCESAINTSRADCDLNIFIISLKKSLLSRGANSKLILFKKPIATAFYPKLEFYLKACGSNLHLGESITKLDFQDKELKSFSTKSQENIPCNIALSALNFSALEALLPACQLKEKLSKIEPSDILSFYFTLDKKLFDGDSACLVSSPIHWIFDRQCHNKAKDTYLYSATISAFKAKAPSLSEAKELLQKELDKYFNKATILDFIPIMSKDATIKATPISEANRPKSKEGFTNFYITGDFVKCDLPCTMESAAYNSNNLNRL